ncbi:TasA family protein [Paenibacillus albus]|uniref:Camelysin metallo-endopeptidase n=1 Tax=Paenibacillus albus TaxID=2495582 RepID=A0A3Q8X5L3_9BACL|nr:TasA family protein [Paenibacillus albus]AZN40181.1 hypothetical protein EJC50_11350 [Paenibacillus albus]
MSIKTKLVLLTAVTALGATMVAGGSFALFSDQVTNSGNSFASGNVHISDFSGGNVAKTMLNFDNLAPGDTDTKVITIKNDGSLDAYIGVNGPATQSTRSGKLFEGSSPLQISYDKAPKRVAAGQTATLNITYTMPLSADNFYKNAGGTINIVIDAVQARNNEFTSGVNAFTAPYIFPSDSTPLSPPTTVDTKAPVISEATARYEGQEVLLSFKTDEAIDLGPLSTGNVVVRYGTGFGTNFVDANRATGQPIIKNKLWDGYLNSYTSTGTEVKYSQGAAQTPGSGYINILPANTSISTQVKNGDSTWYNTLHNNAASYVRLEVRDNAGNVTVEFVLIH